MVPHFVYVDLRESMPCPLMAPPASSVLCLGNFDGVHVAHAALLREGLRLRDERNLDELCGVFCFFRPTVDYLPATKAWDGRPAHLTSLREKLSLFAGIGLDFACLCDFPAIRDESPADFIRLLETEIGCRAVVCGFNYRFGKNAAGTADTLKSHFSKDGRSAVILPAYRLDGHTVSASEIRRALIDGKADTAARLLGRPYAIDSTVVHGKQLGRTIGFPTANQYFLPGSLIPAHGVYATRCHTPFGVFAGVSNVGCHPTVDHDARINCETYIIGLDRDLYGHRIRVEFLQFLRPEQRFADVDTLTAAIRRDAGTAAQLLAEAPAAIPADRS